MLPVKSNKTCLITIIAVLSCFLCSTAHAAKYYSLDEFFVKNPLERRKASGFDRTVRLDTVAVPQEKLLLRIAIVYPGDQVSDYWRRSYKSMVKRLEQYGIEPELHSFFMKPTAPLAKQNAAFREALATNPDFLVFTLDAIRHQRIIEPILIKNKPQIILQNITTPLKAWDGKQPLMYIGFDHATGARILARYFMNSTGGTGNYAVLLPDQGYLSDERGKTFIDYLDSNSQLKLVSVFRTGIDKAKAKLATLELVKKHPDVKFIYACSTDIAIGAIEGLKESGMLGKIMINGWGGGTPEIEAILKGEMDVTVMRINDDNGVAMADAMIMFALGQKRKLPLVFSGRFELIEKDISSEKLEKLQIESFRFSDR